MANSRALSAFSDQLTSRRGAWVWLGVVLIAFVLLFGMFGGAKAPAGNAQAPLDSESGQVSALMAQLPDADQQSVLVVASRNDSQSLNEADIAALQELSNTLSADAPGDAAAPAAKPILSEDSLAAVVVSKISVGESNTETATVIKDLRHSIAAESTTGPLQDMQLLVTGGPAFGADIAGAFEGADLALLAVTILIVALLLIITYRSPILWIIPLAVVALADGLAGRLTAAVGNTLQLQFDAGIISVLVFGAGTNYALLLISRYREELAKTTDHRLALSTAWRKSTPAILASNITVVLALLTLALAITPGTHGLGISSAVGLLVALFAVLFLLPPLLAIFGRRVFWPFVPKPSMVTDLAGAEVVSGVAIAASPPAAPSKQVKTHQPGRTWRTIATTVMAKPVRSLVAGTLLLGIMMTGLIGTSVGLNQLEKFRVPSESAAGLEVLSGHFPAGEAQPIFVIAAADTSTEVLAAARDIDGVVRAHPLQDTVDGSYTALMVTSEFIPGSPESLEQIAQLRQAVHDIPAAQAMVGGSVASDLDARAANQRDLLLIAPLVLAISFVVLLLLLRSVVAPVLLLLVNLASALAAIGAGSWLSGIIFDQTALDLPVPLLAFLFLVALGIDYTIFLVHRARAEAGTLGTRAGMIEAVARTGSVITSAGIVLAAVFAALGVLPLVTLGQLGLIVGLGVLVDTFVVRTVIVPALFGIVGDRIWWPGKTVLGVRSLAGGSESKIDSSPKLAPESATKTAPVREPASTGAAISAE